MRWLIAGRHVQASQPLPVALQAWTPGVPPAVVHTSICPGTQTHEMTAGSGCHTQRPAVHTPPALRVVQAQRLSEGAAQIGLGDALHSEFIRQVVAPATGLTRLWAGV